VGGKNDRDEVKALVLIRSSSSAKITVDLWTFCTMGVSITTVAGAEAIETARRQSSPTFNGKQAVLEVMILNLVGGKNLKELLLRTT
jgi:hypothetical protein